MFGTDEGIGGLLASVLVVLLVVAGGAYLLLSGGETPPDESAQTPDTTSPGEVAPELIGGEPAPATEDPPAPEPARAQQQKEPEPEADAKTWRIDFDVEGPHWNQAIFQSSAGRPPIRAGNPPDGPDHGTIEVVGPGRLLVRSRLHLTWVSEPLTPPPSGALELTATIEEGLAISGTVIAADGITPVSKGQVRVVEAEGVKGVPDSGPWHAWVHPDDNGFFRITGLRPGKVTLRASSNDRAQGARTQVEVDAGDGRVRIQLDPMGRITVRIFDAETKKAPRTSALNLEYTGSSGHPFTSMMTRNVEAEPGPPVKMTLPNVLLGKPGTIKLRVNGYQYEELTFELPEHGGVVEIDAPLRRDEGGAAKMLVDVRFEGAAEPDSIQVMRHTKHAGMGIPEKIENGRIHVPLPPGTTRIVIGSTFGDGFWMPVTIEIEEGWTEPGSIVEKAVTLIQGGALRFKDRPPHHHGTFERDGETIKRSVSRTREGSTVYGLPAGTWTYRFEGPHAVWSGTAVIEAGEVTDAKPKPRVVK